MFDLFARDATSFVATPEKKIHKYLNKSLERTAPKAMIKTRRSLDSIVYNMHAHAGLKFKRIASDLSAFRRSHQTLPLHYRKAKIN